LEIRLKVTLPLTAVIKKGHNGVAESTTHSQRRELLPWEYISDIWNDVGISTESVAIASP